MYVIVLFIIILTYHFCMVSFAPGDSSYYPEMFLLTTQIFTHILP